MAQVPLAALKLFGVAAHESTSTNALAEGTSLVQFRSVAAVVSQTKYHRVTLDEKEMGEYTRVLEEVQTNSSVLPAPPGTIFRSRESLMRWLELHYFTLTEALSVIEGHSAARVSITTHKGSDNGDGEAHKSFAALAAESLRLLRSQAAATVTLPKADKDEEEGVIARASFLVDTQRWQTFKDTVSKEAQRQSALEFRVTGPWPPYDFVRMQFGG